jgi:hypothetical protein
MLEDIIRQPYLCFAFTQSAIKTPYFSASQFIYRRLSAAWNVTSDNIITMIDTLRQMWKKPPVISYEGESVSRSQVDISRRIYDIQTEKNHFSTCPLSTLICLSRRFTSASKPAT